MHCINKFLLQLLNVYFSPPREIPVGGVFAQFVRTIAGTTVFAVSRNLVFSSFLMFSLSGLVDLLDGNSERIIRTIHLTRDFP